MAIQLRSVALFLDSIAFFTRNNAAYFNWRTFIRVWISANSDLLSQYGTLNSTFRLLTSTIIWISVDFALSVGSISGMTFSYIFADVSVTSAKLSSCEVCLSETKIVDCAAQNSKPVCVFCVNHTHFLFTGLQHSAGYQRLVDMDDQLQLESSLGQIEQGCNTTFLWNGQKSFWRSFLSECMLLFQKIKFSEWTNCKWKY